MSYDVSTKLPSLPPIASNVSIIDTSELTIDTFLSVVWQKEDNSHYAMLVQVPVN